MKFENLRKLVVKECNGYKNDVIDRLNNGDENALVRWSTNYKFIQYKDNVISKDQAIKYAKPRVKKYYTSLIEKELDRIENVENSELPTRITIRFWWTYKNYYICHASVNIDGESYEGVASGYGYDKESSAVAKCFNENNGLLKYLYMKKNESPERSNRDLLGYGAGCGSLPYFEGAVGMDCFIRILESFGFNTNYIPSDQGDAYIFTKETCNE